jgi:predicted TIM-barrel fold metal-dependent hydrolase
MSAPYRIDVHHHLVPPFWVETSSRHCGDPSGRNSPAWSPAALLAFMDTQQIATAVLSLDASSATGWQGEAGRDTARRVNELGAELVAWRPDRFGSFATLPLPDIDAALREIEYAFDTLGADGVVLLSNYAGRYLGDPVFDPLWAELDRREAVVFVHPAKPPIPVMEGVPAPIVDYPFDTTRTAVLLVMNGVMARCTQVKIILSHAGGFLPYHAHRFAELASIVRTDVSASTGLLENFRSFYFDTALSSSPALLCALRSFALPAHLTPRTRVETNSSAARALFAGLAVQHDTAPWSRRSAAHVSCRLSALLTSFQ